MAVPPLVADTVPPLTVTVPFVPLLKMAWPFEPVDDTVPLSTVIAPPLAMAALFKPLAVTVPPVTLISPVEAL